MREGSVVDGCLEAERHASGQRDKQVFTYRSGSTNGASGTASPAGI